MESEGPNEDVIAISELKKILKKQWIFIVSDSEMVLYKKKKKQMLV